MIPDKRQQILTAHAAFICQVVEFSQNSDRKAEFETNKTRRWPDIIRGGQEIHTPPDVWGEETTGYMQGVAGSPGVVTGADYQSLVERFIAEDPLVERRQQLFEAVQRSEVGIS